MAHDNMVACEHCGDVYEAETMIEACGNLYCCEHCAELDGYIQCDHCGEWFDDMDVVYLGEYHRYCSTDCAVAVGGEACAKCGELLQPSDGIRIGELLYHVDCIPEGVEVALCQSCGRWGLREHMFPVTDACRNTWYFCSEQEAREYGARRCEACGKWHINGARRDGRRVALPYCSDACAEALGLEQCMYCGEWHPVELMFTPNGNWFYCSREHAAFHHWRICDHCGEWYRMHSGITLQSRTRGYCSEDCAVADGCIRCDGCGQWFSTRDNVYNVQNEHGNFCSRGCCRRAGWVQCEDCGEWVERHESHVIDGHGDVCLSCYELGDYEQCEECGYYYPACEVSYNSGDGRMLCDSCLEEWEESDRIHAYSHKPDPIFHGASGVHMGIELETDDPRGYGCCRAELSRALNALDEWEDNFYQKADCSLENGIEIVSHPMTLSYHAQYKWDDVLEVVRSHGFRSHDAGTCGLHVHVSRDYAGGYSEAEFWGMRLWALVEGNRDEFARFSRRTHNQLGHWASFDNPDDVQAVKDAPTGGKYGVWVEYTSGNKRGRYHAINYQNRDTVEFRLFRGTLNYRTFLATLAMVDGLARYAKAYSMDACEQCGFGRLVYWIAYTCASPKASRAIVAYCRERDLV